MNNKQAEIRPCRFLTTELSDEEAERIAASRMDKHIAREQKFEGLVALFGEVEKPRAH